MSDKPTEDDVLDKVKQSRQNNSQSNRDSITTEGQAAIAEQERIVRERARLIDVVQRNSTIPCSVSSIEIRGALQTRTSFLRTVTSPLHEPDSASTLSSVIQSTNKIHNTLMSYNIFDPTRSYVTFDRARSPLADPNDVDVIFHLREKPRFAAQTGTWAGDGEATAQMSARAENLFGGAERVEGRLEAGTRTRSAWEVKFQSPIGARPDILGEIAFFGRVRDQKFFASHELWQRGAHVSVKTISKVGLHEFTVASILRQVGWVSPTASPSVLAAAGDSIKTSLSHTFLRDKRDDPWLPSQGYFLKSVQEYTGLAGSDVQFLKATAEVQYIKTFRQLWPRTHFVYGARGGILWSLENDARTRITDRFFLGGPTDVRGFREYGIGPKDGNDSVGGEAFAAYSASILFPVPNAPPSWPIRLQAFVNAGALLPLNREHVGATLSELVKRPSVGVGVGLIYRTPIGRVELNFGIPVTMRQGDWARKGFQFGIGIEFM